VRTDREKLAALDAVIAATAKVSSDRAEAIASLVGAIVVICSNARDPVANLQVAINGLTEARNICGGRVAAPVGDLPS
jgi:hypothetical protein